MEFVEDWNIIQVLGEGAYGEVKLLVHRVTNETVAVKIVDLQKNDAAACVKKETYIHKMLKHPNIIQYYGKRQELLKEYIFMEYAAGGELFNKIEPDIGMSADKAHTYMLQLLSGVNYLHDVGIAHRDLKPENILLDANDNIKISDFGLATIFRLNGKERVLDKRCGTLPYIAPEVTTGRYRAVPADLWSCGIIFVALLTGELPWDKPTEDCKEYKYWLTEDYLTITPWSKLGNCALSLARKILNPVSNSRPNVNGILCQPWMQQMWRNHTDQVDCGADSKKIRRQTSLAETDNSETPPVALSQPLPQTKTLIAPRYLSKLLQTREPLKCFSQPTQNEDLIINSSQIQFTQSPVTQNNFQHLIKRMTRFFVVTNCEKTISELCSVLDKFIYSWNIDASGFVTISTVDSKKMQLVFKANVVDMDGKTLLDFRLNKGCGLEFKRRFLKLKSALKYIVLTDSKAAEV